MESGLTLIRNSCQAKFASKQSLATRADLHVSVIKLARHAATHAPKMVVGDDQGALVAVGYGQP